MLRQRPLTTLDAFLLACIDSGVTSAYELREIACISLGASLPSLHRLQTAELITRHQSASRNRQEIRLTAAGRRTLRATVNKFLEQAIASPPRDIDSVLRLVALAIWKGDKRAAVAVAKAATEAEPDRPADRRTSAAAWIDFYCELSEELERKRRKLYGDVCSAARTRITGTKT